MRSFWGWSFILGVVIYIVVRILLNALPPFDPTSELPWEVRTLNFLGACGLTLAVSGMIMGGLTSIRKFGLKWSNVLVSLFGVGMVAVLLFINYQASTLLSNDAFLKKDMEILQQLESLANADMRLENKAELSLSYAQMKFSHEGEKIKYVDRRGNLVDFEPSPEDIKNRNVQISLEKQATWGKKYPLQSAVYWSVVGIASLLVGIFVPVKRD